MKRKEGRKKGREEEREEVRKGGTVYVLGNTWLN